MHPPTDQTTPRADAAHPASGAEHARQFFRSPIRVLMVILAICIALMAIVRAQLMERNKQAVVGYPDGTVPNLPVFGEAPTFEFTERSEKTVSSHDLRGKVWVADFIFTNCGTICPPMTARMAELQRGFSEAPDLRLVSFTVDPRRDTPDILRAYADRYKADPNRWWFLRGSPQDVRRVAAGGFKLGSIDDPVMHSNRFVLIDRRGQIRGYYDSSDPEDIDRLTDAIGFLLASRSP